MATLSQLFDSLKNTRRWPHVTDFRSAIFKEYDSVIKDKDHSKFTQLTDLVDILRNRNYLSRAPEAASLVDGAELEYRRYCGVSTQSSSSQHKSTLLKNEHTNTRIDPNRTERNETGAFSRATTSQNEEFVRSQRSKEAGYRMQLANPNIADLSDPWRPTKIAEQFSELYDNQWTEAYEALSKIKQGARSELLEENVVGILLTVVQDAYEYCQAKSHRQLTELKCAFVDVMAKSNKGISDKEKYNFATKLNDDLLNENRKAVAELSIPALQAEFYDHLKNICVNKYRMTKPPTKPGPLATYADRAVELSWWMCVQTPPVHMCETGDRQPDPALYRTYTKNGSTLAFYVWPALQLHKGGPLLAKGTVQYK